MALVGGSKSDRSRQRWAHLLGFFLLLFLLLLLLVHLQLIHHSRTHDALLLDLAFLWRRCGFRFFCLFVGCFFGFSLRKRDDARPMSWQQQQPFGAGGAGGRHLDNLVVRVSLSVTSARALVVAVVFVNCRLHRTKRARTTNNDIRRLTYAWDKRQVPHTLAAAAANRCPIRLISQGNFKTFSKPFHRPFSFSFYCLTFIGSFIDSLLLHRHPINSLSSPNKTKNKWTVSRLLLLLYIFSSSSSSFFYCFNVRSTTRRPSRRPTFASCPTRCTERHIHLSRLRCDWRAHPKKKEENFEIAWFHLRNWKWLRWQIPFRIFIYIYK